MSTVEAGALAESRASSSRYPWILIGLLWMCAFLNNADRSIVVAVMPQLRAEFGLTPTQLALISSAFFWVYAVCAFASGHFGDRLKRSRVIMFGLAFWSIATGIVSLSTGFAMLLALRGFVALGESTYYPAATALISDWHKPKYRSRALSLHQTGVFAGAGFGALFSGMLADHMGWRAPFIIFGAIGLVVVVVLLKYLKDAPRSSAVPAAVAQGGAVEAGANKAAFGSASGAASVAAASGTASLVKSPLTTVLTTPSALLLCVVFFLANGASNGLTIWAPTFVHDALGLNLGDSALYGSATINVAGFLSVPLGGLLADTLAKRTSIGRFYTLAIGLAFAGILLLPLVLAGSAMQVGLVLLTSSIGKGVFDGCIYAAMHDVIPSHARATAVGLMTMIGFFGAGLTPIFVAQAAGTFGMAAGITSLAVLYFVAVGLLLATRNVTRRNVQATRIFEGRGAHD